MLPMKYIDLVTPWIKASFRFEEELFDQIDLSVSQRETTERMVN